MGVVQSNWTGTDMTPGAPVRRPTDRGLRPHPRGEGRCEEAINSFLLIDEVIDGRLPGSRREGLRTADTFGWQMAQNDMGDATDMYNIALVFVRLITKLQRHGGRPTMSHLNICNRSIDHQCHVVAKLLNDQQQRS